MSQISKIDFQNSKIKKMINFEKIFGWKPYGGKSGSLNSILIVSRPNFKVFGPEFNEKVGFPPLPASLQWRYSETLNIRKPLIKPTPPSFVGH